jgi:hypothetical protein
MSALRSKADIFKNGFHVRYVPIADIRHRARVAPVVLAGRSYFSTDTRCMTLLRTLNSIPSWMLTLSLLAVFELYSVGLMFLSRRKWGIDRLKLNNEVAGFKFSVIGVLYAVLLAFVVIAVWANYNATETAIRNEAKAVGDMAQLSYALPQPQGEQMRRLLDAYVKEVQQSEWATMARGLPSKKTADALAHLTQAVFDTQVGQLRDLAVFQQALRLLAVVEDNRNERLDSADGSVPRILWLVLIAGALVTLGYPAFFGTINVVAQTLMTATLAALVAFILLPAILLDFPFTGEVVLSSTAFDEALQQIPPHLKEPATQAPSP